MKPKKVSRKVLRKIIETRRPIGLFYTKYHWRFIGVDNRTGDAWTREFLTKKAYLKWLKGRE